MTKAAITPGTQPHRVRRKTISMDPQPLPITAKGGNKIANKTRKKLIARLILIDVLIRRKSNGIVTIYIVLTSF